MNSWNGIGRLTRDVEQRHLPNGDAVANFTLAVDTGTKQKPSTMFLDCTAFGKTCEVIVQYAGTKGSQLAVSARLTQDNWTDKDTGGKRSKICCVVERITLIGSRRDSSDQTPSSYSGEEPQTSHNGFDGSGSADPTSDVPF